MRRRPPDEPEPLSPGTPEIGRRSGPTTRRARESAYECLKRAAVARHPHTHDWWILHAVANVTGEDIPDLATAEATKRTAAEAKARREAAEAASPAMIEACHAIASGSVKFVTYPGFDGEFVVRTPYDPRIVEILRSIPGARWDEARGVWNVPARSHAALAGHVANINVWSAQTVAANAEAALVAEKARGAERAALAARRYIEFADRAPVAGTTMCRGNRLVVIESLNKVFRAPEDDGLLDPWMEGEPVRYVYHRDATDAEVAALQAREPKAASAMVAQQANAGAAPAPAWLLEAVHGPDGARDPRVGGLGGLGHLRDLLRACHHYGVMQALIVDSDDPDAVCGMIGEVEDLYRRLATLTGQRTDVYDREHPDRVAAEVAWVEAGEGIPF